MGLVGLGAFGTLRFKDYAQRDGMAKDFFFTKGRSNISSRDTT